MDLKEHHEVRKSLLMSWKVCPRQAWYSVRDPGYEQYNEFNTGNSALLLGQIFHREMDNFYSAIDVNTMITFVKDEDQLIDYLFKKFSKTTHEECIKYFKWYASIEAKRFIELYNNNTTGIVQRFIPLYIEKEVRCLDDENGIYRKGHFDRMDYIGDNNLRLVEYKTGRSYDITKSYKLTKLRLELYWYKHIIEKMEEFKNYKVTEWMLINPTLQITYVSKFSILTEKALQESTRRLTSDINQETPAKRMLNFYCEKCKYKQKCLIIPQNIFEVTD